MGNDNQPATCIDTMYNLLDFGIEFRSVEKCVRFKKGLICLHNMFRLKCLQSCFGFGYSKTCGLFKSNQITFIVTSPQHKCLGE